MKTPRDIPKINDLDWAASDKPTLACADGCIRVMDLKFKTGSAPMEYLVLPGNIIILNPCSVGTSDFV